MTQKITYVPESMQERYNDIIVEYFRAIGQPAPEAQVSHLAECFPRAYFQRAAEACQHRINELADHASPGSLEILAGFRDNAVVTAEALLKSEKGITEDTI